MTDRRKTNKELEQDRVAPENDDTVEGLNLRIIVFFVNSL